MADDFFGQQQEAKEEMEKVAETIKIGEQEFSPEEAQKLVELGKAGKELSEKYNVPMEKIWPNHQKVINENKELRNKLDEIEKQNIQSKQEQGQQLSPEEMARTVKDELRKYGAVLNEDLDKIVNEKFAQTKEADKLLGEVNNAISGLEKDYGIKATDLEVLEWMQQNGGTPKTAVKLMFEEQIDKVKEERLSSLRPKEYVTTETSSGGKEPSEVKLNDGNLTQNIHELFEALKSQK